jgi:DNA repair exonuclease SbcCD ATPase subunit
VARIKPSRAVSEPLPSLALAAKETPKQPAKPAVDQATLQQVQGEAQRLAGEHRETERQMEELVQQGELLKSEHDRHRRAQSQLSELIAMGQVRLQELRSKLSGDAQQDFDIQRQIQAAQTELQQLEQAAAAAITTTAPTIEIAANGTPISKIVDGDEVHFQLRGGRIAYVPMEELVEMARREMKPELDRLKTLSQLQDATEREIQHPRPPRLSNEVRPDVRCRSRGQSREHQHEPLRDSPHAKLPGRNGG